MLLFVVTDGDSTDPVATAQEVREDVRASFPQVKLILRHFDKYTIMVNQNMQYRRTLITFQIALGSSICFQGS